MWHSICLECTPYLVPARSYCPRLSSERFGSTTHFTTRRLGSSQMVSLEIQSQDKVARSLSRYASALSISCFLPRSLLERQGKWSKVQVELLSRMGCFRARVVGGAGTNRTYVCYLWRGQGCLTTIFIYWRIRSVKYLLVTDSL